MSSADVTSSQNSAVPVRRTRQLPAYAMGFGASSRPEIPIGYAALMKDLGITGYVPVHQTSVAVTSTTRGAHRDEDGYGRVCSFLPGQTPFTPGIAGHLFAALRHDGVDLEALRLIFERLHPQDLAAAIAAHPTSAPARRAWFLYEWITTKTLDLPGGIRTRYVPLFDPVRYVTCEQGRSARHGIIVNALGTSSLCPTIRRTARWDAALASDPLGQRDALIATIDTQALARLTPALATLESSSSFAIEGECSTSEDDDRCARLLKEVTSQDQLVITAERLHAFQNILLTDRRHASAGTYRTHQVWVGRRAGSSPMPSHIAPQPADVPELMGGFCSISQGLTAAADLNRINPIAVAAVSSGLLAYIHPYMDGNGRLGRLLLQQPLTRRTGVHQTYIPISAAIFRHRHGYYTALESWSRPLLTRIPYDEVDGGVAVRGSTRDLYRYPDLTRYAEFIATVSCEAVSRDFSLECKRSCLG